MGTSSSKTRFDAEAPERLLPLWDGDGCISVNIPRYTQEYAKTTLYINTGMGGSLILHCNGRQKGMTLTSSQEEELAIIMKRNNESYRIFKPNTPVYPEQQSVPNPNCKTQALYPVATVKGKIIGGKKITKMFCINQEDAIMEFHHGNSGCGTMQLSNGTEFGTCTVQQGIKHVQFDNRAGFADVGLLISFVAVAELVEQALIMASASELAFAA